MSVTMTLPSGRKVRYQGHYRYVVVIDDPSRARPVILRRSNDLRTADKVAMANYHSVVMDTVTKQAV
jgi:hypothetical protein